MKYIKSTDNDILELIVVAITLLTQLPFLLEYNSKFKILLIALWLILLIKNMKSLNIKVNNSFTLRLVLILIFNIYIFVNSFFNLNYLRSVHFMSINMSFIFLLVGYTTRKKNFVEFIKKISIIFILCVFFITINVYFDKFFRVDAMESSKYLYSSKNSLGILITFSIVFLINFKKKILGDILIIWLIFMLLLIQNRTGIICVLVYIILSLINKKIKIKKRYIILFVIGVALILIFYDKVSEFIFWSLKLDLSNNLDDLSSGRLTLYDRAINSFLDSPFLGNPLYYVDNFYICILAEYGVLGFLIVIPMILLLIKDAFNILRKKNNMIFYLLIISVIVSFFEAIPPFGPGAVYFIIWYYYGMYIAN
ncbi:O-antigen ligase family protein [Clostridium perfringens]|uniref:O-antigen ligase family protein n=1 Tax=Clostridium perfringens TaxID=1502 RepID=UPI0024BC66FB|nr:O-antigen ligase family protein [Clostridium perfringens]